MTQLTLGPEGLRQALVNFDVSPYKGGSAQKKGNLQQSNQHGKVFINAFYHPLPSSSEWVSEEVESNYKEHAKTHDS